MRINRVVKNRHIHLNKQKVLVPKPAVARKFVQDNYLVKS